MDSHQNRWEDEKTARRIEVLRAQVERQAAELETYRTAFDGIEEAAVLRAKLAKVVEALTRALADVAYVPGDLPIVPVKHDRFVKAVDTALKEIGHG